MQTKPTPPHLTSVQAEQLLARACENEAENAKRMRMGLEPISQPMPTCPFVASPAIDVINNAGTVTNVSGAATGTLAVAAGQPGAPVVLFPTTSGEKQLKAEYKSEQLASLLAAQPNQPQPGILFNGNGNPAVAAAAAMYRPTAVFPANSISATGTAQTTVVGGVQTSTMAAFPGTQTLLAQGQALQAAPIQNGNGRKKFENAGSS